MICTAARGGMRAVVDGYRADGLFDQWNVELLETHAEGSVGVRVKMASLAIFRFIGLLMRRQVTLVHCHAAMRGSFWRKSIFSILASFGGVPVAFHLHGSEMKVFVNSQPKPLRWIISWILTRQSIVIVLSESWCKYVLSIAPQARIQVLHNYVALPDIGDKVYGVNGKVNLLFLGLVGDRKGVFDLLPALKVALDQLPNLHLVIGGNGEVERARQEARRLGIERNVTFAGWVGGQEKLKLLSEADIFVLPSHNEGLPVSLIEAMSWSVPVVSTRVGGIPELVRDGEDGLLFQAGDRTALAAAILKLAGNRAARNSIGLSARERIEKHFSKDVVFPQLEGIYARLMSVGS